MVPRNTASSGRHEHSVSMIPRTRFRVRAIRPLRGSIRCVVLLAAIACGTLSAAALQGCSPDAPMPDALYQSAEVAPCGDLTYENFGAKFFPDYCLRCHNEQLVGDIARTDAPTGINYNTLDDIRAFQRRIRLRAGEQGDMPPRLLPVPAPSDEERIKLMRWIDCGTP